MQRRAVQQVHLRQLAVGHLGEQRLLPLLGHALALGHVDQGGLDHHRYRVVFFNLHPLDLDHFLALASRLLTDALVFHRFAFLAPGLKPAVQREAQVFGPVPPGKTEHARQAQHQQREHGQRRTRESQPAHGQRSHSMAQHATRIPWQQTLQAVQPAPLQRGAGHQQQAQRKPENSAPTPDALPHGGLLQRMRLVVRIQPLVPPYPACQRRQPGPHTGKKAPPDRKTQQEITPVGQQSAEPAAPVARFKPGARGAPGRVGQRVAQQGQQPERQRCGAQHEPDLLGKTGHPRRCRVGTVGVERVE